jgi:plasmid stabilization system protein ParE
MSFIPKRSKNIVRRRFGTRTVALRFIASVEDAIKRIVDAPTHWRLIDEDVRRCLTHIFPYAVPYTIETDFLLIVAVMHCSREPGYWRLRVGNR